MNTLDQSVHAVTNYPEAWKQHYLVHQFYQRDPALRHAARSHAPIQWSRLTGDPDFKSVFADAQDFGISPIGLTIPVRGPYGDIGMLSVSCKTTPGAWERHSAHIMVQLQERAAVIHDSIMRNGLVLRATAPPVLSHRELEVLQWTAAGKGQADIADILSISARTIEVHLRTARTKLSALNTAQAVARAVGLGLIYPL